MPGEVQFLRSWLAVTDTHAEDTLRSNRSNLCKGLPKFPGLNRDFIIFVASTAYCGVLRNLFDPIKFL